MFHPLDRIDVVQLPPRNPPVTLIVEYNICTLKKNSKKKNGYYIFTLHFAVFFQRVLNKTCDRKVLFYNKIRVCAIFLKEVENRSKTKQD